MLCYVHRKQFNQCHSLVKADLVTNSLSKALSSLFSHPLSHLSCNGFIVNRFSVTNSHDTITTTNKLQIITRRKVL